MGLLTPRIPDEFNNAKYEQIVCAGLKPRYNGATTELVPTLTLIHIHHQNEAWYPATLLPQADGTMIELVQQFSKVKTTDVEARTKQIWESDTIAVDRLTRGTPAYYAKLFGGFLTNSLTSDFLTLLYSRMNPAHGADGPLLLHTLCTYSPQSYCLRGIHQNYHLIVDPAKSQRCCDYRTAFVSSAQQERTILPTTTLFHTF
jgi:hypothetical protein